MIFTSHSCFSSVTPKVQKRLEAAINFLKEADFSSLEDETYTIDENNVYAMVQSFCVEDEINVPFETHEKYIDVQYVISGRLDICIAPKDKLTVCSSYDEENDVIFYESYDDESIIKIQPGSYAVLFPSDGHRMVCKSNGIEPVKIRKCVVKVSQAD